MGGFNRSAIRRALVILLIVIVAGATAQAVFIDAFNKTAHTATGKSEPQGSYLQFSNRADSTSTWLKRDFVLDGQTVDLQAQTIDGTFFNDSDDTVESWVMRIDIQGDCFINNAWCGTVEIHQFTGTEKEAVQTLDLRSYDLADVELSNLYDGDLLIPLTKGDYIIYYPSEKDDELQIAPHTELTMGMIFYYLGDLDLSEYTVDYYYHRDFTYGIGFIVLIALALLWLFLFVGMKAADASYKRAMKDLELRKSGLASMSSIYSIISFIDLETDEIMPVYANEKTSKKLPEGSGARKQLRTVFEWDTSDAYREYVCEFVDTDTLPERLDRESIACEYISNTFGWSRVRFFAADRTETGVLKRVLLTVQDINDEKRELSRFEERATLAEHENRARNAFIAGVSSSLQFPIQDIQEFDERIIAESDEKAIRRYALQIKSRTKLLSYMVDSAVNSAQLVVGDIGPAVEEYSFSAMVEDIRDIAETMMRDKPLHLETDIPSTFPDSLMGDSMGIERTLIGIFAFATRQATTDSVRLSIYGKEHDDCVHLLFSVHVNKASLTAGEAKSLANFIASMGEGGGYVAGGESQELEMAAVQLAYLHSELNIVNSPQEECEFYFEIEQGIAKPLAASTKGVS